MACILVMDDRELNRSYLSSLLGYGGHQVLLACDGIEGLEVTRASRPDLVIADILMPRMDGYEFVRNLRADPLIADTKVLFHTANYHEPEAIRLAEICGVEQVLTKPCEPEIILETVEQILGAGASRFPSAIDEDFDREHLVLMTNKLSAESDALQRSNSRLRSLIQLGLDLGAELDSSVMFRVFCDGIREIIGARYSLVLMEDSNGSSKKTSYSSGMDESLRKVAGRVRPSAEMGRLVGEAGQPCRLADWVELGFQAPRTPSDSHDSSVLAFPILTSGNLHGWIYLLGKLGESSFNEEDSQSLHMMAGLLSRNHEIRTLYTDLRRHSEKLTEEISVRQRGASELKRVGDLLNRVVQGTSDAIYVKDLDGRYVLFNNAASRLVGREVGEVIGKTDFDLFPLATASNFVGNDQAVLEAGESIDFEEQIELDQQTVCLLTTRGPYRDEHGEVIGVQGISVDITDRKRIEQSLRESEARYKKVVEDQTDAVCRFNADGRFVFLNDVFANTFGDLTRDGAARGLEGIILGDDREHAQGKLGKLSTANPVVTMECRVKTADQIILWMEFACRGFYSPVGNLLEIQAVGRDITVRKEAATLLAIQHEVVKGFARGADEHSSVREFLHTVCDAGEWTLGEIWLADSDNGKFKLARSRHAVDSSGGEHEGPSPEGLSISVSLIDLMGKVTADPVWIEDLRSDCLFEPGHRENRFHCCLMVPMKSADVNQGVMLLFDENPRKLNDNFFSTMKSIGLTAGQYLVKRRTEDKLRLFRSLIDNTLDSVEVIDSKTGRFVDVNSRACVVHGYSREEFLRLRVDQLDPDVSGTPWLRDSQQSGGNISRSFESRHRRKDGTFFPVEVNLSHTSLDRDYLIAIVRDITDRKALEEQFRQSQKMDALGRLAGGVAHDFNNLLTVIGGYGQMLLAGIPSVDPNHELIKEMVDSGERAASLTRQLLAFSRKSIIVPQKFELSQTLTDIERMLGRIVDEDIELRVTLDPGALTTILADPGQMEQVIVNLVVNAKDAMPNGGRLTLLLKNTEITEAQSKQIPNSKPGRFVMLIVEDTGCGMDRETISRVFEPFFSTKGDRGTGLGLSTVHGIINQLGGFVQLESELGVGTKFMVHIPLAEGNSIVVRPPKRETKYPRGTECVLLVEDEAAVRKMTKNLLASFGYTVIEAENGQAAMELIRNRRDSINLVITDVIMPKMGGGDLYFEAKAVCASLKFLFVSGYTDDAILRQGILQKEVHFLPKPFSPMALATEVRQAIDSGGRRSGHGNAIA